MARTQERSQSQYASRPDQRSQGRFQARRSRPGGQPRSRGNASGRIQLGAEQWIEETQHFRSCIDACNAAFAYVLEQADEEHAHTIACLVDCIEVCGVTANLVARESEFAEQAEELCAGITKACEEALEEFDDDPVLTAAADACRECAEACES